MNNIEITDKMVDILRERIKPYMKEKRYFHVLGVEREAVLLGKLYLPGEINKLRTAALLHDITKKLSVSEHIELCRELGVDLSEEEISSPKLLHSKSGAALTVRDFPEYADSKVVSAIRWHTTGYRDMDMFESIIYLADYIEDTRTFPDCVVLRKYFWDRISHDSKEKYTVFVETMVKSFDMTVKCLIDDVAPIDRNTVEARNRFVSELRKEVCSFERIL